MSARKDTDGLSAVRGYLIDLDGTLYVGDRLVDGAAEFVDRLRDREIPHAFVTNVTSRPRRQLLARIREKGLEIEPDHVLTAPLATKGYLDRHSIGSCFFLTRPTLIEDFDGHPQSEDQAEAVVVGDMGNLVTFQHLNIAFRLLLRGAHFVTMSRSRYFRDQDGMSLDAGSFVAMLEHASGKRAVVTGKPSAEFFQSGLELIRLQAAEVAMIGDDLDSDVGGAQNVGITGILVLSGKTTERPTADAPIQADVVLESVADLLDVL